MLLNKNSCQFYLASGVIILILLTIISLQLLDWGGFESSSKLNSKNETVNLVSSQKTGVDLQDHKTQVDDVEISKRIQLLESSLKDLHSQLANKAIQKTDNQSPEQSNEENTDMVAIEREKTNQLVNYLDQQMRMEKIDTAWSEDTKAKVYLAFAEKGLVNKVECFTSLCRVSADHDNQDAERAFIRKLTSLKPFINTDAFIERKDHEDGSVSTQIFISRSNYRLPEPVAEP